MQALEQVFENGDRVFYKRKEKECWLGPGQVVFQDGKVVFVRHGAVIVRISPNRLQKVTSYLAGDGDRKSEHSLEDRDDEKQDEKEEPEPHTVSEELPAGSPDKEDTQNVQQNRKMPKAYDNIQYKLQNTEEWIKATVHKEELEKQLVKINAGITYRKMDELGFYIPSTVFQSFRDDGRMNMKGSVLCLFVLRLNVPVNNFSVMSGRRKAL